MKAARLLVAVVSAVWGCSTLLGAPPRTDKRPVTDEFHGVKVAEDYRWLEDWGDPAVKAWSEAQNAHARSVLDAIPFADAVRTRLKELEEAVSIEYFHLAHRDGTVFALKTEPPRQQPMLVLMRGTDPATERVVVDPNALDPAGHTTIDWYVPSPDGSLVAVSMSVGGSEAGDVHVFDVSTGRERTGDLVPRAHGGTAGGSLAWARDGKGFYYTRYPRAGERPDSDMDFWVQVYFHRLGTPTAQDTYEVGKGFPKIAEIVLEVAPDDAYVLASVQNGDGGEFMHWVRREGAWTQVTRWEDRAVHAVAGHAGLLLLASHAESPRGTVLAMNAGEPFSKARTVVPVAADGAAISTDFFGGTGLLVADGTLYVWYQNGGPCEVRRFALARDGVASPRGAIDAPPISTIGEVVDLGRGEVLYNHESFLSPPAWFRLGSDGSSRPTPLAQKAPPACDGLEVVREFATSKDGTKIPISIIRPKGTKLDGSNPTIVYGYGGYGVCITPSFSPRRLVWTDQGGVYAIANIRGGGEFGEDWHRQGNLTNKQNVFDDFAAAVNHVVERGYATRERVAIQGGSNGGLLMGAMMTQHPGLCRAVASAVGIYDMLRVELSPNGAFNVTEFGTVKDPAQFRALHAYSPLHHVKDGTSYPAAIFTTGANDPRVDPMQSRKFVARLQAADPGGTFLLRTSANAGHGVGSSLDQRVEEYTDIYSFLFRQLGVAYKPVR